MDASNELTMATSSLTDTFSSLCGICESAQQAKYCLQCHGGLCDGCAKQHSETNLFKDHRLIDDNYSEFASAEADSGLSVCIKHPQRSLDLYCTTCRRFLCKRCKADHVGHTIKPAKDDVKIQKEAYVKYMRDILAEVHRLEEQKSKIEDIIASYDKAVAIVDKWEIQILDSIREKADELRKEFRLAKEKYVSLLDNDAKSINKSIDEAETQLNALYVLRKVPDTDIMAQELTTTQVLVDKLKETIENLQCIEIPNIEDLLPNAYDAIDNIHNPERIDDIAEAIVDHNSLELMGKIVIINPHHHFGYSDGGYRVSRSNGHGNLILHSKDGPEIRVFKTDTYTQISECVSDVDIGNMVTLTPSQHAAINSNQSGIHLLDDLFKTVSVMSSQNRIWDVGYLCRSHFVVYEITKSKPFKAYIYTMCVVDGSKLIKNSEVIVDVEYEPYYMAVHPDKRRVSLCCASVNYVYTINIISGSSATHVLPNHRNPNYICVDGKGEAWIGDDNGKINHYNSCYHYKEVLDFSPSQEIRDLIIHLRRLYVCFHNNIVTVYRTIEHNS